MPFHVLIKSLLNELLPCLFMSTVIREEAFTEAPNSDRLEWFVFPRGWEWNPGPWARLAVTLPLSSNRLASALDSCDPGRRKHCEPLSTKRMKPIGIKIH